MKLVYSLRRSLISTNSRIIGVRKRAAESLHVMPGLVPGIHVFRMRRKEDVDGRDKPGHDES
jgi:hypothetical protein